MEDDEFFDESTLPSGVSFVRLTAPQLEEFTRQLTIDEPAALALADILSAHSTRRRLVGRRQCRSRIAS